MLLRIVKITEAIAKGQWHAIDVLTKEEVAISMRGKLRMHRMDEMLQAGDECVAMFSPTEPFRGRIVTPTNFKGDLTNKNWNKHSALKAAYEAKFGTYETDGYWFKRER